MALGQNPIVALHDMGRLQLEDAVIMSERSGEDDVYTSVHLEEYEPDKRDTSLGLKKLPVKFQTLGKMPLRDSG